MGLIADLFQTEPEIRVWSDFRSSEAQALVSKHFIRVGYIPALYSAIESTHGWLEFDTGEVATIRQLRDGCVNLAAPNKPPKEIKQLIGGAIVHYE